VAVRKNETIAGGAFFQGGQTAVSYVPTSTKSNPPLTPAGNRPAT
jgi:hypothetical protein